MEMEPISSYVKTPSLMHLFCTARLSLAIQPHKTAEK